jgi:uncharacterized protein YutE (UPF0331/DUF86 family)/predicted nucleotidyltransferase
MPVQIPLDSLRKHLKADLPFLFPQVQLVYLFGSQADRTAGDLSDIDLGILLDRSAINQPDTEGVRACLAHKITDILGALSIRFHPDIVWLDRAPLELKFEIIRQGYSLYERIETERIEFEADTMSRFFDYLPVWKAFRSQILVGGEYGLLGFAELGDELNERLARLETLKNRSRREFDEDPFLRDIVERNLEVAVQCCLDICHRIVATEKARKPVDYYETILLMGELGVIPGDFSRKLAPLAGFRNILVHEYLSINWDFVYDNLQKLDDLARFADLVRIWIGRTESE